MKILWCRIPHQQFPLLLILNRVHHKIICKTVHCGGKIWQGCCCHVKRSLTSMSRCECGSYVWVMGGCVALLFILLRPPSGPSIYDVCKIFQFLKPLIPLSAFTLNLPYWAPLLCPLFQDPPPHSSADVINGSSLPFSKQMLGCLRDHRCERVHFQLQLW